MLNINIVTGKAFTALETRFTNADKILGESSDYFSFIASLIAQYRDTGDTNCLHTALTAGKLRSGSLILTTQIVSKFAAHKWNTKGTGFVGKKLKSLADNIKVDNEEITETIQQMVDRHDAKAAKANAKRKATVKAKQDKVIEDAVTEAVESVEEVALPAAPALQVAATPDEHYAKIAAHIQALLDMGETVDKIESLIALSILSQAQEVEAA